MEEKDNVTLQPETAASEKNGPLLKVEHLKKYFPIKTDFFGRPTRYLKAVDDISFDLDGGKTLGVVGESGCGKTTLGRTILKLYEPDGGSISFNGDDITGLKKSQMMKYRTDIQLIFQDPYSSLPPRMTVGAIIAEPVRVHNTVPKEQVHDYVLDIMKKCGLKAQHYDRYPHEFSGGQRQRICIARALAVKPKLVICDEPVSALDVSIQAQIINLLKDLQKSDGLTYVFISHDLSVVKYITDNILVMYLGNAMEMSDTDDLFDNPLHPYTQALFSAVPIPNPGVKKPRIMLEGDIPSPANPPEGCKFHTRCGKCMKVCKYKIPEYTEVKPGHFVACHLYDEDVMSRLSEFDEEYDRIQEEKRVAAELEQQKKQSSGINRILGFFKKKKQTAEPLTASNSDAQAEGQETAAPEAEKSTPPTEQVNKDEAAAATPVADEQPVAAPTVDKQKDEQPATSQVEQAASVDTDTDVTVAAPTEAEQPQAEASTEATDSAQAQEAAAPTPKKRTTTAKKTGTAKTGTTASRTTAAKTGTTASKTTAAKTGTTASKSAAAKSGTTAKKSTAAKSGTTASKSATAKSGTTASKSTAAKSGTTAKKTGAAKTSAKKSADATDGVSKKPVAAQTKKVSKTEVDGEDN